MSSYYEDEFGFAGFTPGTFNGNLGGRNGAHKACGLAFAGAHLCHTSEYIISGTAVPVPAWGAWIDASLAVFGVLPADDAASPLYGRFTGNACTNWTAVASGTGYLIAADGAVSNAACNTFHSLACCNGAPRVVFAGVSSVNATMGGRAQMHALCNASFAGSHLCHGSEYLRADSTASIPVSGAWLDPSSDFRSIVTLHSSPIYERYIGGACANWTSTTVGSGYMATYDGAVATAPCNVARPVACCF